MKKKIGKLLKLLIFIFLVFGFGNSLFAKSTNLNCLKKTEMLKCLGNNFNALYLNDNEQFWTILKKWEKTHSNNKDIADFLSLVKVKAGNAEFNEYFSQIIERQLLPNRTQNFLDSLLLIDRKASNQILNELKHPMFVKISRVKSVLEKYRDKEIYKELLYSYFNKSL